jgi:hypothetical protein
MDMRFILKNMGMAEGLITIRFMLMGSTFNEFEVDYYGRIAIS